MERSEALPPDEFLIHKLWQFNRPTMGYSLTSKVIQVGA